ncbi:hypothetical protein [Streptomyces sp. NRRL S-1813]|uniref:hypothetical protein n=1 Tax=Streptomyces sp. NRRL S-1813 TaxID=1463888 RepID=UPI00131DB1C6|nr:hypothetical protein [Streptomyces sp. NRRL S-1813]
MRVFGVWHGGTGYATGDVVTHMESWSSLKAAKLALWRRADSNGYPVDDQAHVVDFDEDGRATVGLAQGAIIYPCVEAKETDIHLYAANRDGDGWAVAVDYPTARLFLGPRGGVRIENV